MWTPAQIRLQIAPLRRAECARPSRPLPLAQGAQAAPLEATDPTLHGGVVLAEEAGHLTARVARREQQQPVKPMVKPYTADLNTRTPMSTKEMRTKAAWKKVVKLVSSLRWTLT